MGSIYSTAAWQLARRDVLRRDGNRCSISRLLGGDCSPVLHVHHLVRPEDGGHPYDPDNLGTVCARHHPAWERLRRYVANHRNPGTPRCPHRHVTAEARAICEARLARERQAA